MDSNGNISLEDVSKLRGTMGVQPGVQQQGQPTQGSVSSAPVPAPPGYQSPKPPNQYDMMAAMKAQAVQNNTVSTQKPAPNIPGFNADGTIANQGQVATMTGAQMQQMQGMPSQQSNVNVQNATQQMQAQATQQKPSAQAAMRERMMRNNGVQQTNSTVMQQGVGYNPVGGTASAGQSMQQNQQAQQMQHGAQSDGMQPIAESGGEIATTGIKLSKGMVLGIAGGAIVLLLVCVFLFSGSKSKEEDETDVYDPMTDESLEWITPEEQFAYDSVEIENLRNAGYTGSEIEESERQQIPARDLIKQAEAERDAWIQQAIAPLYDTASDDYKNFISQTWLTLPQRKDLDEWTQLGSYYTDRKNLDFEKIDVYGSQLFVKIYLDDNEHKNWFFLSVTPEEWNKLGDRGNIMVNYTYCTHLVGDDYWSSEEDMDNIFITDATIEFAY